MTPARRIKTLFFRLHQQHHRCFYCGCDLTNPEIEITIDHVVPRSLYKYTKGAFHSQPNHQHFDAPENIVAACRCCNRVKGDSLPKDEQLDRLGNLNQEYSETQADTHYDSMLRMSAHIMRAAGYNRL